MTTDKKVLMILPHLGTGGDWVVVQSLSKTLKAKGYELQLASNGHEEKIEKIYSKFIYLKINHGFKGFIFSLSKLFYFDRNIKIIHAHSTNTLLFSLFIRLLRCRNALIVLTLHLQLEDKPLQRWIKKHLLFKVNYLHCVSEDMVTHVNKFYQQPLSKISYIHLGTDACRFKKVNSTEKRIFKDTLNLLEDDFVLLFSGRLNPEKNIPLILNSLALLKSEHPNLKLIIAGEGPCRKQLEEIVQAKAIKQQVYFLGHISNMRPIYGASDLLVLPSITETFGLVVIEAALCGTPCLRSDTPGAKEQIVDGLNGLIYSKNNPQEFHDKLVNLLKSPNRAQKMGEVAHKTGLEKFTVEAMGAQFDKLYGKLA